VETFIEMMLVGTPDDAVSIAMVPEGDGANESPQA